MPAPEAPVAGGGAVQRWAVVALVGLTAVVAAACLLVFQVSPVAVAAVVVVPAALVALAAAVRVPDGGLVALLVLTVVLFQPDDGLQPAEVAYLLLYLVVLATWYGSRLVSGEPMTRSRLDRVALFLTVVGVGGGALLGVLHGAPPLAIQGEVTGFSTVALFLPVREFVRRHRHGASVVGAILVWFGVWISVRNIFDAYVAIAGATQLWQIADVRAANGDLTLHVGTVVAFGTATALRGRLLKALAVAAGTVCLVGVFLAKSRGYWVDFAFALVLLFVFAPPSGRRRLVVGGVGTVAVLAVPLLAVLGPTAAVLLSGAVRRVSSIGGSLTGDVSLINRFVETRAVWAKIQANPVVGHGFGTEFSYHSVLSEGIATSSFVHNGFVGLWYKVGLWGLLAMAVLWVGSGATGIWASRYGAGLSRVERGLALGAGVAMLSLLPTVTTSNPFLLFDTFIVVAVAMGLAHGLTQRPAAGAGR